MLALIRAVVLSKNQLQRRAFHLTAQKKIKEIVINENKDKNEIIIEGKYLDEVELTKTEILRFPEDDHKTKCAFCKLEKQGVYVQYTDTLVLRQFLREDGTILPKKVTGLCKKQQSIPFSSFNVLHFMKIHKFNINGTKSWVRYALINA